MAETPWEPIDEKDVPEHVKNGDSWVKVPDRRLTPEEALELLERIEGAN